MTVLAQAPFDPGAEAQTLLNMLAWLATAAGVFGLITCGIYLAIQYYSGQPGAGGMYMKQIGFVGLACVMAATAGPLVSVLDI
ncbi:hypothetical protein FKR81_41050 [Lentzea tibetensis]|uniref:Uncharacterized protein n=1 Tax=Lentzea tibetensis TaxID=2591470 RepID=A0A563EFH0_9PSEU|nr:hypothetical protein [Lentzea tibetensis]TWP44515.1 hypothetical protein FKR81_41050 [Lentzea tibetensis]